MLLGDMHVSGDTADDPVKWSNTQHTFQTTTKWSDRWEMGK